MAISLSKYVIKLNSCVITGNRRRLEVYLVGPMATEAEFFEKWTSILYTEASVQPNGCLEVLRMPRNKQGYPIIKVTVPYVYTSCNPCYSTVA